MSRRASELIVVGAEVAVALWLRVVHVGIVGYRTPQQGADVRRYVNVTLHEPAAIAPSPPRS